MANELKEVSVSDRAHFSFSCLFIVEDQTQDLVYARPLSYGPSPILVFKMAPFS